MIRLQTRLFILRLHDETVGWHQATGITWSEENDLYSSKKLLAARCITRCMGEPHVTPSPCKIHLHSQSHKERAEEHRVSDFQKQICTSSVSAGLSWRKVHNVENRGFEGKFYPCKTVPHCHSLPSCPPSRASSSLTLHLRKGDRKLADSKIKSSPCLNIHVLT